MIDLRRFKLTNKKLEDIIITEQSLNLSKQRLFMVLDFQPLIELFTLTKEDVIIVKPWIEYNVYNKKPFTKTKKKDILKHITYEDYLNSGLVELNIDDAVKLEFELIDDKLKIVEDFIIVPIRWNSNRLIVYLTKDKK